MEEFDYMLGKWRTKIHIMIRVEQTQWVFLYQQS